MSTPKPFQSGCLVCGASTRPYGSRGLCQAHYRQFTTKLKSFAKPEQAEEFEQDSIRLGWVLPLTGGGRPKAWSPFDDIANEVRERHLDYDQSAQELANEVLKNDKPIAKPDLKSRKRKGS